MGRVNKSAKGRRAPGRSRRAPGKRERESLIRDIKEAMKDPEFRKGVREFIRYHTGRSS